MEGRQPSHVPVGYGLVRVTSYGESKPQIAKVGWETMGSERVPTDNYNTGGRGETKK